MEFAHNNSYQASIGMAPYEDLYRHKCRTPVCWDEVGERKLVGPEIVQVTCDKVKVIRDRLKIAQNRQKSYADNSCRDLEFEVGDMVFLKISPWKGVLRFGKRGKLSPRYIGPYRIVERIGEVAYRLELPSDLDRIHDFFPCFYAPQVYTRPFTCIDRETSRNTGEFDILRGTSADPRPSRASLYRW